MIDRLKQKLLDRWNCGDRGRVEEFLDCSPPTELDVGALMDLIDMEVVLRQRLGEHPTVTEYLRRFPNPKFNKPLRELFYFQQCLDAVVLANTQQSWGTASTSALAGRTDHVQVLFEGEELRYRLERRLGAGGYGEVYLAYDNLLERNVAIKLAFPEVSGAQEHLLSEARMMAQLHHPNIVDVYDLAAVDDRPFIVSCFVQGDNLQKRLQRGKPTLIESLNVVSQIADALHYVHVHGIIHRDVKPSNILIDEVKRPQLTDFGLAIHYRNLASEEGKIPGTRLYLSPELILGMGHM